MKQEVIAMVRESIEFVRQSDPVIADLIGKEWKRQQDNLELIAS